MVEGDVLCGWGGVQTEGDVVGVVVFCFFCCFFDIDIHSDGLSIILLEMAGNENGHGGKGSKFLDVGTVA